MGHLFNNWLDETRQMQEYYFGIDYDEFSLHAEDTEKIRALIQYISWNTKAATHELVELDAETAWKPWQHDDPYVHRREVIKEAVDVLHFIGNILTGVKCTDEELDEIYLAKMEVNRQRQLRKYTVKADGEKCRQCRRALDDVRPSDSDPTLCVLCGGGTDGE